jgi:hypothetical protein
MYARQGSTQRCRRRLSGGLRGALIAGKMLQHVMSCVALHNIVCLTRHKPSLMMVTTIIRA